MTLPTRPLPVLLGLLLALAGQQKSPPVPHPDQEAVGLETHLVLLNVSVTGAGGRHAGGLAQGDFRIYEDGQPQQISAFGSEETPFAAAILLDVSGSQEQMLRIGRASARQFAGGLRTEDVYSVYVFAGKVAQIQEFSNAPELEDIIWTIRPDGYTALYDCVAAASKALALRPERRRAILVLSDGDDTRSAISQEAALRAALESEVAIYGVDLVDENTPSTRAVMARNSLKNLAAKTGGRYIGDQGGSGMNQAFKEIVEELSHQYTLGYSPRTDRRDGKWRRVEVRTERIGLQLRTRQGYYAPKKK